MKLESSIQFQKEFFRRDNACKLQSIALGNRRNHKTRDLRVELVERLHSSQIRCRGLPLELTLDRGQNPGSPGDDRVDFGPMACPPEGQFPVLLPVFIQTNKLLKDPLLEKSALLKGCGGLLESTQEGPCDPVIEKIELRLMTHSFSCASQIAIEKKADQGVFEDRVVLPYCCEGHLAVPGHGGEIDLFGELTCCHIQEVLKTLKVPNKGFRFDFFPEIGDGVGPEQVLSLHGLLVRESGADLGKRAVCEDLLKVEIICQFVMGG